MKSCIRVNFADVEIIGTFENCNTKYAKVEGIKGLYINFDKNRDQTHSLIK